MMTKRLGVTLSKRSEGALGERRGFDRHRGYQW